jgi:signal transduction histidine kinase
MLDDFIISNHEMIVARARARVASRPSPSRSRDGAMTGIPVFLTQLAEALGRARVSDEIDHEQISDSACRHGSDLLEAGVTIGQVVHDYGDVCQTITELVVEQSVSISGEEFRTLNLCLDDAIAGAVTEYARQSEKSILEQGTERLGILAHELRGTLVTAMLSFESIRSGRVGVSGSTGLVLARSLAGLRGLIDRSLADVRLDVGIDRLEPLSVAELVEEIEIGASIQAEARRLHFTATSVDRSVMITGDRQILVAAISNMLQNAFKFTRVQGNVSLRVKADDARVTFEIEDECGGLPPGQSEDLFRPFEQRGGDRSGVGLGLAICLKAAKASGGAIHVRDIPGKGCVFSFDLKRTPTPSTAAETRAVS